jgi:ABC-type nitrate/sulfonate/bicarbonate transport system substrate-binding protein
MKQPKIKSIWQVAVFVALVWLLPGAEAVSAQGKVNIIHLGALGSWSVPLHIAQEEGLFTKHGVEVQLIRAPDAEVPRLTRENPFAYIGAPAALLQAAEGTDLKILGSFNSARVSSHVVAGPDIKRPEQLRGKRFGVYVIGAGAWIQSILALEYLGLDPKRDNISIVAIGDAPQRAQALEAGTIDAAVLFPTQSNQLRAKGFSVLLDLYPANIYGVQNALVVTTTYLQQRPDVVEKVVAALVEAMAFSLAPTNKARVQKTIIELFNLTDLAGAERGYRDLADLNRKPYPSVERLKTMQRVIALHDRKMLNLRVEDLIDDRFVRKLDENGVIDRLYSTYGVK